MSFRLTSLLTALLATTGYAQFFAREQVATLILAEQSAINSSNECGDYYYTAVPAAVSVSIFGNFTAGNCHNIAEIFSTDSYDNDTLVTLPNTDAVSSCTPGQPNCDNTYSVSGLNHFSPSANYSQVQVDFIYGALQSVQAGVQAITITIFAEEQCEQDATVPWFSWGGCEGAGIERSCREVPYSVKSFRIDQAVSTTDLECQVGAERGAAMRTITRTVAAVVGGAVIVSMMVMM